MTGLAERAAGWAKTLLREPVTAEALAGDGGGRRYFRLKDRGLVVLCGPDPAENFAWLRLGRHLWFQGLPLPRIVDFDLEQGFFLLEDVGDTQLAGPGDMTAAYPEAARLLARFHIKGAVGFNPAWGHQRRVYDAAMATEDEILYYVKAFVEGYCGLNLPTRVAAEARRLGRLAAPRPGERVLMHRDYQGRNLMFHQGEIRIIDWQGARPGPAAYDLSSLIEETPHHPLSEDLRAATVAAYMKTRGANAWKKDFGRELTVVGAVRMMQALGAYGRLSSQGKNKFIPYIPPLLRRLAARFENPALAPFPRLRGLTEQAVLHIERERT